MSSAAAVDSWACIKLGCLVVQASILDIATTHRSSLGDHADHVIKHASTASRVMVGLGAVVIVAFLNKLLGRRRRSV